MRVDLAFGPTRVALNFPADVAVEVVAPTQGPGLASCPEEAKAEEATLAAALDAPVCSPALEDLAAGRRRVTIVVPDGSRDARRPLVVPLVVERLARAGVPPDAVTVLVGCGLHAPPAGADAWAPWLGSCPVRRAVAAPDDPSAHDPLPPDLAIARPALHRLVTRADLVVVVGAVAPHDLAGDSGGALGLVVGCGDRATIDGAVRVTLDATVTPDGSVRTWLGRSEGNPFRAALLRVARSLPPPVFLLDVGLERGRVAVAAAGDVEAAHVAACAAWRERTGTVRPAPADVVVAAPGPGRDGDLVEAYGALAPAVDVASPGAPIVWLAHAARGPGHPRLLPWFEAGSLSRHLLALRRGFEPAGLTAYALRSWAARHPIYVASTMPADALRPLGLSPVADPAAAVEAGIQAARAGPLRASRDPGRAGPRVAVLPAAAEIIWS